MYSKQLTCYELNQIELEVDQLNEAIQLSNENTDQDIIDNCIKRLDELIIILERSIKYAKLHERGLRIIK